MQIISDTLYLLQGSIKEDCAAPQDKTLPSMPAVEQHSTEGAPAGLPDSAVQRSTLSHLYDDMSQVLKLSWCGQVWLTVSCEHGPLMVLAAIAYVACTSGNRTFLSRQMICQDWLLPVLVPEHLYTLLSSEEGIYVLLRGSPNSSTGHRRPNTVGTGYAKYRQGINVGGTRDSDRAVASTLTARCSLAECTSGMLHVGEAPPHS